MKKQAIRTCKGEQCGRRAHAKACVLRAEPAHTKQEARAWGKWQVLQMGPIGKLTLRMNDFAESVFREYMGSAYKRENKIEQKGELDHDMVLTKGTQQPLKDLKAGVSLQSYPSPPGDWTQCLQIGENPWWQGEMRTLSMLCAWVSVGIIQWQGSYSGRGTGKQMFQTWELLP